MLFFAEPVRTADMTWEAYRDIRSEWRNSFFHISEHVFSVVWAFGLLAAAVWAARHAQRGLFNTVVTFGAIHAYTQTFESLDSAPLAFAILGLTAIPLAWGVWRYNLRLVKCGSQAG